MRAFARAAGAAAVVALLWAVPSRAGVALPVPLGPGAVSTTSGYSFAGPRLAGTSLVWVVDEASGYVVRTAGAGGRQAALATLPKRGDSRYVQLAASARRVAVVEEAYACDYDCRTSHALPGKVLAGPLSGPLEQIAGCSMGRTSCSAGCEYGSTFSVDVWEDTVALVNRCDTLLVRDYSAPAGTPDTVLPRVFGALVAGRFVAWPDFGANSGSVLGVVVYDRIAGAEAYRVEADIRSFAIQADGKVVFSRPGLSGAEVAWASPGEPFAHVIDTPPSPPDVRIAGDRVAVRSASSLRDQRIRVLTLSGNTEATVDARAPIGDFDFDGHRLAWAARRCQDALVLAWTPGDGEPPGPAAGRCPAATIDQHLLAIPRQGPARVRLACPSTGLLGCGGRVRMLADASGRRRARRGDLYLLGYISYGISAGQRARLDLRLTPQARRFALRHRGAAVQATSVASPPAGSGLAGTFEVRSGTLRLSR